MLLVHLVPYIVPEIQEKGLMEHYYAQTINKS